MALEETFERPQTILLKVAVLSMVSICFNTFHADIFRGKFFCSIFLQ